MNATKISVIFLVAAISNLSFGCVTTKYDVTQKPYVEIILKIKSNSGCRYGLTVFDTIGEEIFSERGFLVDGIQTKMIKVNDLRPGIYFLRIKSGRYIGLRTFVKI